MSEGNGQLPDGWAEATVEQVCDDTRTGLVRSAKQQGDNRAIPYVRMGEFDKNGRWYFNKLTRVDASEEEAATFDLQAGDVLFNTRNSAELVGKVAIWPAGREGYVYNNNLLRLRFPTEIVSHFVGIQMQAPEFVSSLDEVKSATTNVAALYLRDLKTRTLRVAPLAEQRRIVSAIESLQERSSRAREAISEVRPLLKEFRKSVLRAAFSGHLTADWRAANPDVEPASELLQRIRTERRHRWEQSELAKYQAKGKKPPNNFENRYKEPPPAESDDLPKLPDSWAWATVDELTELITSGSRAWSKYYDMGDGTFIMAQNIRPGRLDFSKERQLVGPPPEPDSDRKRSQVEPGDLLVTIVGANTGDICPVEEELPEHWVCQSVALLRLVMPEMYGLVLRYFLPGGGGRVRFDKVIYGQGRPHLGFDDLRSMPVPIPPIEEQSKLLCVIAGLEKSMNAAEEVLPASESALTQLDQAILAKAFRGELVPQDPNDEPASKLLTRIKMKRILGSLGNPDAPIKILVLAAEGCGESIYAAHRDGQWVFCSEGSVMDLDEDDSEVWRRWESDPTRSLDEAVSECWYQLAPVIEEPAFAPIIRDWYESAVESLGEYEREQHNRWAAPRWQRAFDEAKRPTGRTRQREAGKNGRGK